MAKYILTKKDKEILNRVVAALLDENQKAIIETSYNKGNILLSEPHIPMKEGSFRGQVGNRSLNAYPARSIKIGKISLRKTIGEYVQIRTPEGDEASIPCSPNSSDLTAFLVWNAAISRADGHMTDMSFYLKKAGYEPNMTKGKKTTKLNDAIENLKSLGIPEKDMKHLMAKKYGRE